MPQLTFRTLREAQSTTRTEFVPSIAKRHHFVKLPSGRWCRTLGPPKGEGLVKKRGRVWHVPYTS
jgi:hypothetical protein